MSIKMLRFLHVKSHQEIQEKLRKQEEWQVFVGVFFFFSKQGMVGLQMLFKVYSAEL